MEGIVWESVWVAVGFVIFVALVWKRIGSVLNTMLDDRSARIKADLDEARTLREEALDELHQFQRLHREAAEEAKAILKNAEATAERIRRRSRGTAKERSSAASSRRRQRSGQLKLQWSTSSAKRRRASPLPRQRRSLPRSLTTKPDWHSSTKPPAKSRN